MEKRVFLAIFLSFVVLAVYQSYFAPPPPAPVTAGQTAAPPPASAPAAGAGTTPQPGAAPVEAPAPATPAAAPIVADSQARDIVVETAAVRAVFTTRGAALKSWQLKEYLQNGTPLDLVPPGVPTDQPLPFTISTDDAAQSAVLSSALFQPSATGLTLDRDAGTLTFQYRDASGLNARKTFYFQPEGRPFQINVEASVDVNGTVQPVNILWGPAVGLGYATDGTTYMPPRALVYRDGDIERFDADDVLAQPRYEGALRFVGVEDHYFLTAALPRDQQVRVDFRAVNAPMDATPRTFVSYAVRVNPNAGPSGGTALAYFIGPKDFDKLRAMDPQLTYAIDFGMFRWLVVPLLRALKGLNVYIDNYGWSIIILTVLLNLAMFPLRHKSMVSMRKMQALQPEVKSIQDRYAKYKVTDPERQKMNQEMLALYKQKGVNPASGCVPMLLTMPVLFAFYAMLSVAIELRGAPFLGWITDLAGPDPIYVTPILMGGTMLWQQMMMPTTADPVQAKMFLMLPLVFTVMFLAAPSGLVIYWLVSNLMAILQQYMTNRMIGAPPGSRPLARLPVKGRASPAAGRAQ
jgi:YidC/Oxa1 family membrane protein insertase